MIDPMLRGEAASLGEAEASQPRDCRETDMPDDYHPPMPRRNPEDIDLGAINADLEFLIEMVTRFRKEQAFKPLYTMIGSATVVPCDGRGGAPPDDPALERCRDGSPRPRHASGVDLQD